MDAAFVHKLSGVAPSVALHIPWDKTDDWTDLKDYADQKGITIGAINPNLFQKDEYKLGFLCSPFQESREMALVHMTGCCEIMKKTGSDILSVWLADGINYAGQDDLMRRKELLEDGLMSLYKVLPAGGRMLLKLM